MSKICIGILIFVYSVVANNGVAPHCEKVEMSATLPHSLTGISHNIGRDNLMGKIRNLTGQTFGTLTVKYLSTIINNHAVWRCECNCGEYVYVRSGNLISGNTRSCGASIHRIKHGFNRPNNRHPLYQALHRIKDRCYNINDKRYIHYGGRGITVCDEWRNDYESFVKWGLNNGWKKGLTIDRINNEGNYTPDNCRFVSVAVNNRNQQLLRKNNTTGYRGVSKHGDKWTAHITHGKDMYLGIFTSPRLAALRYDVEAFKLNDGRPMNFIESVK